MSNPDTNPQVDKLLQEGINLARAGDKGRAREVLEQVVELDKHNEKAWFWLAAVVDSDEEKRVCLGNVVVINPNNARAKRLLEQLEHGQTEIVTQRKPDAESDGPSRNMVYLAIGLGVVAIVVLLVLLVMVLGGGDDEKNGETTPTSGQAAAVADTSTPGESSANGQAAGSTATATAVLPTPLPSQTPSPLPPTWTPRPSATPANLGPGTPLPTIASNPGGLIIMRSGEIPGDDANQPIAVIRPDGSNRVFVSTENERGHTPVLSPDSSRYVFIKYAPGTREVVMQFNNLHGTEPRSGSARWGGSPILDKQNAPAWSPDGNWVAFTAIGLASATVDVYRVSMAGPEGDPEALERLTADDAVESWPAWSPDSQRLVYAVDLAKVELNGANELRIYTVEDGQTSSLTTNGNELIEAAPDWSPDGRYIVFHAQEAGATETDIYRIPADGSAPAEKIIDSDFNDIQPRFSPDGRYIVFSSDRTGNWDVFIYEIASETLYQVTTDPVTDIANDWGP